MTKATNIKMFIGDPGSCHLGDYQTAKDLITAAMDNGMDAVKFQLYPNHPRFTRHGNIPLPWPWFEGLVEYGDNIGFEVFASVWDIHAYNRVKRLCKSIKFSYKSTGARLIPMALHSFKNVYVSGDFDNPVPVGCKSLYCVPKYPVRDILDFTGTFDTFDGFSDHTLGSEQTIKAIDCGARIIEKHFRLAGEKYRHTPDGVFAIPPKQIKRIADRIKQ